MTATTPRFGRVQQFLKQIVYGGNDGIVTTFAIVAGFAGARAEGAAEIGTLAVLVFGLANLFADGVSMGLGEFLSLRSQHDLYRARYGLLRADMERDLPAARGRLAGFLQAKGLSQTDAQAASAIFARSPALMTEALLSHGDALDPPANARPAANGLVTFGAFLSFGGIPLMPYVLSAPNGAAFNLSLMATISALVGLGVLRWSATGERPLRAIAETVLVGGLCATVAYVVGALVGG